MSATKVTVKEVPRVKTFSLTDVMKSKGWFKVTGSEGTIVRSEAMKTSLLVIKDGDFFLVVAPDTVTIWNEIRYERFFGAFEVECK